MTIDDDVILKALSKEFPDSEITLMPDSVALLFALEGALRQGRREGRGIRALDDFDYKFYAVKGNMMGSTQGCAFMLKGGTGAVLLSDTNTWVPTQKSNAGDNTPNFVAYVTVNELNGLK